VAHVAFYNLHAIHQMRAHELTLRHPIAHEANNIRLGFQEAVYEPAPDEARGARDERRPVLPKRFIR
jgi:hypothetical protein